MSEAMDVRMLVEQSARNDTNAFRLLVVHFQRMVFGYLGNFLFPRQVLEDLAQETFLRAFKSISDFDFDRGASFSTWLITIARNLAINEKAKIGRRREKSRVLGDGNHSVDEKNPQEILEKRRLESLVQEAVGRLPSKFHSAVILSYFEELSIEEIAEIENCSVGTVKSRVFRGKRILRQLLERENML